MSNDLEPLETGVWLVQLSNLAVQAPPGEEDLALLLRRGFHLVQLAPRPLRHFVACTAAKDQFDHWLESRALLSAALALVGNRLSYNLSHMNSAGRTEAEVWFPTEREVGSATEAGAALAVFKAWLNWLSALGGSGVDLTSLPVRRRFQCARRPRLTEH